MRYWKKVNKTFISVFESKQIIPTIHSGMNIVQLIKSTQFILLIFHDYIIQYFFIDFFRDIYLVFLPFYKDDI